MIITKRADELKPGDILAVEGTNRRNVILKARDIGNGVRVTFAGINLHHTEVESATLVNDREFNVEALDLTPAQERADLLVEVLRDGVKSQMAYAPAGAKLPTWVGNARDLLDEIDPPNPPTIEELLTALKDAAKWANINVDRLDLDDKSACDESEKNLGALLTRARKAGMIK
jgi:hypothetical protein